MPQALHMLSSTQGFGQIGRFSWVHIFPLVSLMAALGQTLPQTPHATQRRALISWHFPRSPVMAKTWQTRTQAVQPVHASLIL